MPGKICILRQPGFTVLLLLEAPKEGLTLNSNNNNKLGVRRKMSKRKLRREEGLRACSDSMYRP